MPLSAGSESPMDVPPPETIPFLLSGMILLLSFERVCTLRAGSGRRSPDESLVQVHLDGASDRHRNPFMELPRREIEHPTPSGRGAAARLLDDEGEGMTLVEQTDLSRRLSGRRVRGIEIDPAFDQDPVNVAHHRPGVASRIGPAARRVGLLQVL